MTTADTKERPRLSPGVVLGDRFEIVKFLGAGSFGEVYHAKQLLFGRPFRDIALKLFAEGVVTAANAREILNDALVLLGLIDEDPSAEVAARFVQVYDMGIVDTPARRAFMSMRLIAGGKTLKQEVYAHRHGGGMPVSLSLRYMRELLQSLAWMHSLDTPAVHGDLKPENVMLTADSRLVLADFGLAARMPMGARGGTIPYDPSEKLLGLMGEPRADIYSVGLIWYELLVGHHPFERVGMSELARGDMSGYVEAHRAARRWPIRRREELLVSQQEERIPPASEINVDLAAHPQLERMLNRCLADKESERFDNARLLLDEIDRYVAGTDGRGPFAPGEMDVMGYGRQPASAAATIAQATPSTERKLADAAALIAEGQPAGALGLADQVLSTEPNSVAALLTRARALAVMPGRLHDADHACSKAMTLAPGDPSVFRTLATVREAQGKRTQAAGFLKTATELERKQPKPRTF